MAKKRIAFFQNELTVGGIQKSLINLLSNFDYTQFDVDLYLFDTQNFWGNALPKALNVHYLKPVSKGWSFVPFSIAKHFICPDFGKCPTYDLAVDFNSYQNSCAVGTLKVPAKKRIMWIHNDVEIKLRSEWKYKLLWSLFKGKFKYYDGFVAVSKGLIEPFRNASRMMHKEIIPIPNYISVEEITEKLQAEPEGFSVDRNCMNFVALGRICHQKGYDLMLQNFADASKAREDLRLYIIGDGEDRLSVIEQIQTLNLTNKVFLLGNQQNPFCYMKYMDAFISTSRYEGQGMNIMEAKVIGLPLYCSKNLEKYVPGLTGYEDMAKALIHAAKAEKNPDLLTTYNAQILESIYQLTE